MNIFHSWIDASLSIRLTLTLGHFLWQGLAIALAAGATITVLRRASAQARYGVLVVALAVMAACPLVTFCVVSVPAAPGPKSVEQVVKGMAFDDVPSSVPSLEIRPEMLHPSHAAVETTRDVPPPDHELKTSLPPAPSEQPIDWQRFAPLAAAGYLAGVLVLLSRLMLGLHGGRRLCRRSEPVEDRMILDELAGQVRSLGLRFTPAVAWCRQVAVPVVVGVLRPTILLPLSLATGLAPNQVAAILTHELAHIRRYDHLVDLAQRLIEAFLFFHPAVWWLSRRIRIEREHCCDDLVVSLGATPIHYSESLLRVAELSQSQPGYDPVPGIVGLYATTRPSRLRQRIARLLGTSTEPHVRLGRASSLVSAILVVLGIGGVFLWNARADLQSNHRVSSEPIADSVKPLTDVAVPEVQTEDNKTREQDLASPQFEALLEALQSEDPAVRDAAIGRLSQSHGKALLDRLKHDDSRVRALAAIALGKLYPPPEGAVQSLAAALQDENYAVCEHAADALGALGPDAREAIPSLVDVLANDADFTGNLRVHAAWALAQIRSNPEIAVPALIKAAEWDASVRIWNVHTTALSALAQFGPDARDAVRVCIKVLSEADRESQNGLRYNAAILLMEIGADARPALALLHRIILDPQDDCRVPAFVALSKIGADAKTAVPALVEALGRDDDRFWAAMALGGIGPAARAALPDLIRIVQAAGDRERAQAALALWQIDPQNELSIPALIEMLNDESYQVRYRARLGLATIGAPARQAAPALVEVMNDSPGIDRVTAARALWRMDWQREKVIEFLVRELQEGNYRAEAAETLGEIGTPAQAAIPSLKIAATDRSLAIRIAAANALKKIDAGEQTEKTKSDDALLQGTWVRVSSEVNGQTITVKAGEAPELVVREDTFAFGGLSENWELLSPERFKLEPKASPKGIDLTPLSEQSGPLRGITYHGIYKLDGDMLTLCLCIARESKRPEKFTTRDDRRVVLDVYRRKQATTEGVTRLTTNDWGPEQDGLRTRLVLLTEKSAVGQPLKFRLELKNFGKAERHFDPQNAAPFRVITIKKENGEAEPYIGPTYQTAGGPKPIKPGEAVVLWDDYDAAEHFLLADPGKYVMQTSGARAIPPPPIPGFREPAQSAIPPSNAVTVELAPGKLPEPKAMFVRMREILPEGKAWRISMSSGVIFFTHSPTNLKKDVTTIQFWFDEKVHPPGYSLGEGANKVPVDRLGQTKLGFAYITAPPRAREIWPEHREQILKRLKSAEEVGEPIVAQNESGRATYISRRVPSKDAPDDEYPQLQMRWNLVVPADLSEADYARLLDLFNVKLAVEDVGQWVFVSQVSGDKPRVERKEGLGEKQISFTWQDGPARPIDLQLLRSAGISPTDQHAVHLIYPFEFEQYLARLERDYLIIAKSSRDMRIVRRTTFVLKKARSGYGFGVESQRYFGDEPEPAKEVDGSKEKTKPAQVLVVKRDGDTVREALIVAATQRREPETVWKKLLEVQRLRGLAGEQPLALGEWLTDQEAIVSADGPDRDGNTLVARQFLLSLPEGSGLRAEFSGDEVNFREEKNKTVIAVRGGRLRLVDPSGVARATAATAMRDAVLEIEAWSNGGGEVVLQVLASRPHLAIPVRVELDPTTGIPAGEKQPPHEAVRYKLFPRDDADKRPTQFKMQWIYDLEELQRRSKNETGNRTRKDENSADVGDRHGPTTQFFGIEAAGMKVVYVIDRSGSMSQRDRLGTCKRELLASLAKLPAESQFQLVFYNLKPQMMRVDGTRQTLANATDANKDLARAFIDPITADGGTEHMSALTMALNLNPDVIFLVTDADDLRTADVRRVTEINAGRTHIHTVLFGLDSVDPSASGLSELARSNGGVYRYVDATTFQSSDFATRADPQAVDEKEASARKPWVARGRVIGADGQPMPGVEVQAHCGHGSLFMTGSTKTDADGRYEMRFGPGVAMSQDNNVQLQAATISVHKLGHFERNLHRQGDRLAAWSLQGVEFPVWGKKDKDAVFLPGEPKEINFVILPAAKASGTLVDKDGKPLAGYRMSLTGSELPPSSSALASGGKTDENGRFEFREIPTGYRFQILIEPPKAEPPWAAWAVVPLEFRDSDKAELIAVRDGWELAATRLEIVLAGPGVNRREAIKQAIESKAINYRGENLLEHREGDHVRISTATLRLILGGTNDAPQP